MQSLRMHCQRDSCLHRVDRFSQVAIASPFVSVKAARLHSLLQSHRTSCMLLKAGAPQDTALSFDCTGISWTFSWPHTGCNYCQVTIRTVRLHLLCITWFGLHSFPVFITRPAGFPANAGGDWRSFNAVQRQRRADMVCLYGTTTRLVPRSKGYAVTGSLDNSVHALFALQVSQAVNFQKPAPRAMLPLCYCE